jgi:hypothetical protein
MLNTANSVQAICVFRNHTNQCIIRLSRGSLTLPDAEQRENRDSMLCKHHWIPTTHTLLITHMQVLNRTPSALRRLQCM